MSESPVDPSRRAAIYTEIEQERRKQDEKHGGPQADDALGPDNWLSVFIKHLGRAVPAARWSFKASQFRSAMIVVAAIAVAAIEWSDRRTERGDDVEESTE